MTHELVVVTTGYSYTWFGWPWNHAGSLSVEEFCPGGAQGTLDFVNWSWWLIIILSADDDVLAVLDIWLWWRLGCWKWPICCALFCLKGTLKKITESDLSLLDPHRSTGWINFVRPIWSSQDVNVGHSWQIHKVSDSPGRVRNDPY